MTLTDRELATVLAALRHWQDYIAQHRPENPGYEYFYTDDGIDRSPLTGAEIDALIEDNLNLREGALPPMIVKITPNDRGNPPSKLADAELHFSEGPLEGLKLVGFSIWEQRSGAGRNVTFPARTYAINGDRRSFALLRPIVDTMAQGKLRELILDTYSEWEAQQTRVHGSADAGNTAIVD